MYGFLNNKQIIWDLNVSYSRTYCTTSDFQTTTNQPYVSYFIFKINSLLYNLDIVLHYPLWALLFRHVLICIRKIALLVTYSSIRSSLIFSVEHSRFAMFSNNNMFMILKKYISYYLSKTITFQNLNIL